MINDRCITVNMVNDLTIISLRVLIAVHAHVKIWTGHICVVKHSIRKWWSKCNQRTLSTHRYYEKAPGWSVTAYRWVKQWVASKQIYSSVKTSSYQFYQIFKLRKGKIVRDTFFTGKMGTNSVSLAVSYIVCGFTNPSWFHGRKWSCYINVAVQALLHMPAFVKLRWDIHLKK